MYLDSHELRAQLRVLQNVHTSEWGSWSQQFGEDSDTRVVPIFIFSVSEQIPLFVDDGDTAKPAVDMVRVLYVIVLTSGDRCAEPQHTLQITLFI